MSWSWSWFRVSFNISSGFCEFAKCDSLDEFVYELTFPSAVMNVSEIVRSDHERSQARSRWDRVPDGQVITFPYDFASHGVIAVTM